VLLQVADSKAVVTSVATEPAAAPPEQATASPQNNRSSSHSKTSDAPQGCDTTNGISAAAQAEEHQGCDTTNVTSTAQADEHQFIRVRINGDGNCLFRAFAYLHCGNQDDHKRYRIACCDYMAQHPSLFTGIVDYQSAGLLDLSVKKRWLAYLARMRTNGVHGDESEIKALQARYKVNVEVWQDRQVRRYPDSSEPQWTTVRLAFEGGNHYNALEPHNDLFRAFAKLSISGTDDHEQVREKCCQYMQDHKSEFLDTVTGDFDAHVQKMRRGGQAGEPEILCLERCYNVSVNIWEGNQIKRTSRRTVNFDKDQKQYSLRPVEASTDVSRSDAAQSCERSADQLLRLMPEQLNGTDKMQIDPNAETKEIVGDAAAEAIIEGALEFGLGHAEGHAPEILPDLLVGIAGATSLAHGVLGAGRLALYSYFKGDYRHEHLCEALLGDVKTIKSEVLAQKGVPIQSARRYIDFALIHLKPTYPTLETEEALNKAMRGDLTIEDQHHAYDYLKKAEENAIKAMDTETVSALHTVK
jgi:hypothetical protein